MKRETLKKGRYRFLRQIGKGNSSEVYLAEDMTTGLRVALKLIGVNALPLQPEALRFFHYEVKTIARLCYSGIIPLLDHGEEMINGVLTPFVVMPYCLEGSLATWLENRENCKALSLQDVARMVSQAADALQYAHEHGVMHLSVKPSNVLISGGTSFQQLLLSDFSMSAFLSETSEKGWLAAGSPIYMAPEQWQDRAVLATDQYALAVMTYLLLTGRPPFQGNPEELKDAHINIPPASPSTINPILSQGIDTVLLRALEKEPADRFSTISAFASAFEQIIQPMAAPAMVTPVPTRALRKDWDGNGSDITASFI